jgi:CheY-like chemotaxis protein
MHGGRVEAHSAGPNRGSEFVVRLPARAGVADRAAGGEPSPGAAPPAARKVLVVDDNVDAATCLAVLLRAAGHAVTTAGGGAAALTAAQADRPDAVLLDIGMPGMDGYEVARRLRQGPAADTLIVALTGYGQEDDRRRSQAAGFDHHLVKPAELEEILALLATARPRPVSYG